MLSTFSHTTPRIPATFKLLPTDGFDLHKSSLQVTVKPVLETTVPIQAFLNQPKRTCI